MKYYNDPTVKVPAIIFAIVIAVLIAIGVIGSYFEAKTYNKLTGAHVTTWDAMWVDLRVQDGAAQGEHP